MRRRYLIGGFAGVALISAGFWLLSKRSNRAEATTKSGDSGYVDPSTCAFCHREIYETYRLTGMARSLYRPGPGKMVEDFQTHNHFYDQASDRYYTMTERDGRWYVRRHQMGFGGKETNVIEKPIDYVIGSGNHVRSYLSRTLEGKLLELPVSWYSEKGGYWAMSPGYDRADQLDFRRVIPTDCIFCHNRYLPPDQISRAEEGEPVFGEHIGEGIDCQRCHGPGRAHEEAAGSGHASRDAIRRAIVNPARLSRDRQIEVCMQCHLEPTSAPLPSRIPKYGQEPFSYRPGEPLQNAFLFFDRAATDATQETFEIAHAAYRLRQSKCFQSSNLTCTTCHNPHNIPRGENAVEQYDAVCRGCHASVHTASAPKSTPVQGSCVGCHMPKRRTDDVVHAVMTDHFIQRRKPTRDLLAPLRDVDFEGKHSYRGEVRLYYPPQLPQTPENTLYLDVAQVRDGTNTTAGIPKFREDLEKFRPGEPQFYFELAEAYFKNANYDDAIQWYQEALRHRAEDRAALKGVGSTLLAAGRLQDAAAALEKAAVLPPPDDKTLRDLGEVYLKEGMLEQAESTLRRAIAANPDNSAETHDLLGFLLGQKQDWSGAETEFREAIRIRPDLAQAHFNLANLLARSQTYPEAQYQFEKAIAVKPDYTDAHHNYGLLLVLLHSYDAALSQLSTAVRLSPKQAQTRSDLADVLTARGRLDEALENYSEAIQLSPNLDAAHLGLGLILLRKGDIAGARAHLEEAAQSPNPDIRNQALKALH